MLIVRALNISVAPVSDYQIWVGVNDRCIFAGKITGHVRANGAQVLLRKIADAMDNTKEGPTHETAAEFFARYLQLDGPVARAKRGQGTSPGSRNSQS